MASKHKAPLAERLKAARSESGLSQKELGVKAGFDEFAASARMNQYETGKHVPDFLSLQKIAQVLNVDPAYFYCQDDRLAEVVKRYSRLTKAEKKKVVI